MTEDLHELNVYDLFAKTLGLDNPTLTKTRKKHGIPLYVTSANGLYLYDDRMDWLSRHTMLVDMSVDVGVSYKLKSQGIQMLADWMKSYIKVKGTLYIPSIKQREALQKRKEHIYSIAKMSGLFFKRYSFCRNCPMSKSSCLRGDDFYCSIFGDSIPEVFRGHDGLSCTLCSKYKVELENIEKKLSNLDKPQANEDSFFSQFKCFYYQTAPSKEVN